MRISIVFLLLLFLINMRTQLTFAACTKASECTSQPAQLMGAVTFTNGCCLDYDPLTATTDQTKLLMFPTTAGKWCVPDVTKNAVDLY